eukprot:UN32751
MEYDHGGCVYAKSASRCSAYTFDSGVEGDPNHDEQACWNGVELNVDETCGIRCKNDYCGRSATLACSENDILTTYDDDGSFDVNCEPLEDECTCHAYTFSEGVIGGDENACFDSASLTSITNTTCSVQCDSGYESDNDDYEEIISCDR